ncbi:MAG: hypothetical protein LC624_01005 [Halobacteriales archaeon]|nr:hypothetical protein [Halobacteriales archaeon]
MGTEPENIENALRGRKTLPETEPNKGSGPGEPEPGAKDAKHGKHGELLSEDEDHRFNVRGGRFNAASTKER